MPDKPPPCILCAEPATMEAASMPLCDHHWWEYIQEYRRYLPSEHRPVFNKMLFNAAERAAYNDAGL